MRVRSGKGSTMRTFKNQYLSTTILVNRVNYSRRLRWSGQLVRMDESRSSFKILIGTPTVKRLLGKPSRRWEDNIKMDLKETGIKTKNLVDFVQYGDDSRALVSAALNLRDS